MKMENHSIIKEYEPIKSKCTMYDCGLISNVSPGGRLTLAVAKWIITFIWRHSDQMRSQWGYLLKKKCENMENYRINL